MDFALTSELQGGCDNTVRPREIADLPGTPHRQPAMPRTPANFRPCPTPVPAAQAIIHFP